MAFKNCKELSLELQRYQLDYYTKGKALKVYHILTETLHKIEFKTDKCATEFYKRYEDLKRIEDLKDINEYSKRFAHNLLRLILIVHNSKFSSDKSLDYSKQ